MIGKISVPDRLSGHFRTQNFRRDRRNELYASNWSTYAMSAFSEVKVPPPIPEAERFAAALETMPAGVRRFFEHQDPAPYRQPESGEDRLELASVAGLASARSPFHAKP